MANVKNASILTSSFLMIAVSMVLFFLPAINGIAGGIVGGYKAGSVGRGIGAAVLPAVIVGLLSWILFASLHAPFLGFIGGVAIGLWALFSSIGLLIGALIGGAIAPNRE
jgi:hypothetical protein